MEENSKFEKATFSFGYAIILFAIIPLFIFSFTINQSLERFTEEKIQKQHLAMEKDLDFFVAKTFSNNYIIKHVRNMVKQISREGFHSPNLLKYRNKILRTKNIALSAYLFKDGKIVHTIPETASNKEFISDYYQALFLNGVELTEKQIKIKESVEKLMGSSMRAEVFRRYPRSLQIVRTGGVNRCFYWTHDRKGLGIFIVISNFPDIIKRTQNSLRTFQNGFGAGIFNKNSNSVTFLPPNGISTETMTLAWKRSQNEGSDFIHFAGKDWLFVFHESGEIWCKVIESSSGKKSIYHFLVFAGYFISSMLLLLLLLGTFQIEFAKNLIDRLESTGIKYRLGWLFCMASIVPLAIALLFSGLGINYRAEILREENCRQALERLNSLENSYIKGYERFRKRCTFLRNASWIKVPDKERIASWAARMTQIEELQRLDIRNIKGEELFSTDDQRLHGAAMASMVFSRMASKKHSPERLQGLGLDITPEEIVSEGILKSDDVGMATVMSKRNQIWRFQLGCGTTALWYWDVYPELATGPSFTAITHQMNWILYKEVRKIISNQSSDRRNFQAIFEIDNWHPRFEFSPRFSGIGKNELKAAAIRSFVSKKFLSREIEIDGSKYLVTMRPDQTQGVGYFILIDLIRSDFILRELEPVTARIFIGTILSILISFIAAMSLSLLFINPISDLESGMNAIRNRVSDFRIKVRRKDEFGKLAGVFNTVLTDMKELKYAAYVQESLLPSKINSISGWDISFLRRSASDLAGDYHDFFEPEKGKIAMIIGDVTGHGISAAIAMSMAKATVSYGKIEQWSFPDQYLERLNALFFKELKPRSKYMTLGAVSIDIESGEVSISNCGHPYPIFYSASERKTSEIEIPSLPLGIRPKRRSEIKKIQMLKGDALLMYSDGFPECPGKKDEPFGYKRLNECFKEIMLPKGNKYNTILESLNSKLDAFRKPGPLPDDITLMLIFRSGNEE
ncbi:MAG: SpoIIE family protein phosphatase [Candidatus Riflebacteria bacterium]|nr:SpoIIE family protein phosphatase [Candidatus Riflebacteria bacterium]